MAEATSLSDAYRRFTLQLYAVGPVAKNTSATALHTGYCNPCTVVMVRTWRCVTNGRVLDIEKWTF